MPRGCSHSESWRSSTASDRSRFARRPRAAKRILGHNDRSVLMER
jgi:hypothetical protein